MTQPVRTRPLPLSPILRRYHQGYTPNGAELAALVEVIEKAQLAEIDAAAPQRDEKA